MTYTYISVLIFMLAVMASLLIFNSRLESWKKAVVILTLCASGMLSYRVMNMAYGYAALLQDSFENVTIISFFPDKPNNKIYIWLKDENSDPKTYVMPYSAKLHNSLEANRQKTQGKPYKGNVNSNVDASNRFEETTEEVEVEALLPVWPPKVGE